MEIPPGEGEVVGISRMGFQGSSPQRTTHIRRVKMSDLAIISSFCISLFGAMMVITALFEGHLVEMEIEEDDE